MRELSTQELDLREQANALAVAIWNEIIKLALENPQDLELYQYVADRSADDLTRVILDILLEGRRRLYVTKSSP